MPFQPGNQEVRKAAIFVPVTDRPIHPFVSISSHLPSILVTDRHSTGASILKILRNTNAPIGVLNAQTQNGAHS
jgi:hypothetical protein